ncbi:MULTISPECIES: beta-N-acetylhexosaminidase [unclassified Paenibacillus]|uniref:beta-N-acetylhexosaminidase n=1 Tax=unclassified Paenibacillus TaxID=185978 RepID=UPI0024BB9E8D|nr:beta-N-acetylhexosaminidase [Paenibacillus sp. RC334]
MDLRNTAGPGDDLDAILAGMSLADKIGQMLMCGFEGTALTDKVRELVATGKIGGIIYFARNVESPEQVARLTASLQRAALEGGTPPLFISIDQEGGMVARVTKDVALMPGGMAIAAAGSEADAYEAAFVSGNELAAMGINLNYAPVMDVNNNADNPVIGVRSFGELPQRVADFGVATLRGFQDAGVAATAKHFPGHGDTAVDSHLDLPTVPHDRTRMEQVELVPFRQAIAEGVDAMMSAHIYFPALEPEKLPVTLSKTVLTGLLREELGFEGIIMTDCMEMNAIAEHYGTVEASVMAIEAGADMILISHRADRQLAAIAAIGRAVAEGRLSEARLDVSVRRLLALKAKRGLLGGGGAVGQALSGLARCGTAAHLEVARRISEASVTLVRNDTPVLPLRRLRTLVITAAPMVATQVDESFAPAPGLGTALSKHGLECEDRVIPSDQFAQYSAELLAVAAAEEIGQIVLGTYNARFNPAQAKLAEALQTLGKPMAVVALRNPYDLLVMPGVQVYAAVYESRPLALESAAKALLGEIPFRGRLPVSLGSAYPAGWGMSL